MRKKDFLLAFIAVLLTAGIWISAAQQRRETPPEIREYQAAMRLEDLAQRLKALERIKAAYPKSAFQTIFADAIDSTKARLAGSVEEVLKHQKPVLDRITGMRKVFTYFMSSLDLIQHLNIRSFDAKKVTAAVVGYAEAGRKLARDPDFLRNLQANEKADLASQVAALSLAEALAYLNEGAPPKAAAALKTYKETGGEEDPLYRFVLGATLAGQGRDKEALDAYLVAAGAQFPAAEEKARELFRKMNNGSLAGFEAALEAKMRALPFHPAPFKPSKPWPGRTVLAELFTGSECPPCVAADLGFDGLLEAYPTSHLAVLEYHLPIPQPDPMANYATQNRAVDYGVDSTPSVFFDGAIHGGGGGGLPQAEKKFGDYAAEVNARIYDLPQVKVEAKAVLRGDKVVVEFSADKDPATADVHVALAQREERFRGANGLLFHKMVVREHLTLDAAARKAKRVEIDLAKAEAAAEEYLADSEAARKFTFREKKAKIDRRQLVAVVFFQDKTNRKVLNATVADVR
jgi:thiol-disulfide isomerase/thioredoxin